MQGYCLIGCRDTALRTKYEIFLVVRRKSLKADCYICRKVGKYCSFWPNSGSLFYALYPEIFQVKFTAYSLVFVLRFCICTASHVIESWKSHCTRQSAVGGRYFFQKYSE